MNHEEAADPNEEGVEIYRFGGFALDLAVLVLRRDGQPLDLRPRPVNALAYLIKHRDRTVSRAELMQVLWPDVRVAPGSLTQTIWEIRQALGEPCTGGAFIKTSRGRGYRFTAVVQVAPSPRASRVSGHYPKSIHMRAVPGA